MSWRAGKSGAVLAATVVAVAGALGCGGSEGEPSTPETLAGAVPEESVFYAEMAVRPGGRERAALESIAAHFPGGGDLAEAIIESINEDLAEDAPSGTRPPTYEEDLEPWLGDRAAISLTEFGDSDVDDDSEGAFVLETTDPDAAAVAFPSLWSESGKPAEKREVDGVTYYQTADGSPVGLVGDLLVGASDVKSFEAVVDVLSGDAPSLADRDEFSYEAGAENGSDAPAFAYLDLKPLIEEEIGSDPDSTVTPDEFLDYAEEAGFNLRDPMTFALSLTGGAAQLDTSVSVTDAGLVEGGDELLQSGSAGSWAATTCPGCLEITRVLFDYGIDQAVSEEDALSAEDLNGFLGALGLDTEALAEAIGPVAVFLRGEAPRMTGMAVATVQDRETVEAGLDAVAALIAADDDSRLQTVPLSGPIARGAEGFSVAVPGLPLPLFVVLRGDRLVLADGPRLAAEALGPPSTQGGQDPLASLQRQLGAGFERAGFADIGRILAIARVASDDEDFLEALPYLRPLERVGLGARVDGGRLILRTSVTFE